MSPSDARCWTRADLSGVLDRLASVAGPGYSRDVDQLRRRTQRRRLRVLVAGEAKRGKSTLINALLDTDLLPTGVVPVTAIATTIRIAGHAADDDMAVGERLEVAFIDGRVESRPRDELAELVTEERNPGNAARVDSVMVTVGGGPLAGLPLELVDTPGLGSVYEHNTAAAQAAYRSLDAVIVVLGADPPITAAEKDLLVELSTRAVATFVVLAKADRLDAGDLAQAVRFTESVIRGTGIRATVWPVSARARDAGFQEFADTFAGYLAERGVEDADRALRHHVRALARQARDEVALAVRAVELDDAEGQARVREFAERLAVLTRQASELDDRLAAGQRRLQRRLDDAAAGQIIEVSAAVRQAVRDQLGPLDDARVIEELGRQVTAALIVERVQAWREEQGRGLEADLAEVVSGVEQARADQLARLREDARTLLDVDLAAAGGPVELAASRRFWFSFSDPPAWELPGAELLRHRGPGAVRRARTRALDAIPELVDRQVGRARADLHQRLAETVRALTGQLRREHGQLLDRLAAAVDQTRTSFATDTVARDAARAGLAGRLAVVGDVLAELADDNLDGRCGVDRSGAVRPD
jgi:GTPase Era involved in 16S rRNA processing